MELTTHEVLVQARNKIDAEGWVQGRDGYVGKHPGANGPFCVVGAIYSVEISPGGGVHPAVQVLERITSRRRLARWNDQQGRTKDDILAAYDRAIAETAPSPDLTFLADVRDRVSA